MVAVFLESYRHDWPQIGKVLQVDEELTIQWFTGTVNSAWKPLTVSGQPWTEKVSPHTLIAAPFTLTRTNRLPGEVRQELREQFEQLYSL